ncbi:Trk family potassium uptake protein [Lactobacillus sp. CBA3606]|uniref:TrkH family potassium uptake protein n=1 Tax=Lactobacillus sp. CBA3606 TaxID=2099789 RepID=UPI000CFA93D2|nr:potassium transporter TrkG [Lactobacillus sp. CBA3606]AVK63243.1 Trk family potassium uptake protein [Lactobacillus sp. CBA3606]
MEKLRRFNFFDTLSKKMVAGFILVITMGTVLLSLPIAAQSGQATALINTLFTATSATCITGLNVVAMTHWTLFGKIVIMGLSEVGALGYMTFAVLISNLMRRNLGLSTQLLVKESLNLENLSDTKSVMQYVIGLSLLFQLGGFGLLALDFVPRYGWQSGLFLSLFHAIMSFCNAGFNIFTNGMATFQSDPYVLLVTMVLVIAGGLGFLVWRDLLLYHERHRLSLNSKLTLVTTISLFVLGFILLLVTERGLALLPADTSWLDRIMNTLFMSVSPRTAGFSVIPVTRLQAGSVLVIMVLMFIGGTPGSTAGGIKTTTFGILVFQSIAQLRGRADVEYGHRRFSQNNLNRALLLVFLASVVLTVAALILAQTETIPKGMGLEYIVFEVLSAFGTVGLSLGLTAKLTLVGKFVIMLLMFIGRVGIFTSLYALSRRQAKTNLIRYPEENILIG